MKAIVSITFDDAFAVHDIKVVEGDKGLFVAMPSKRMPDGEYKDIAHPISSEVREVIQTAVLKEYEKKHPGKFQIFYRDQNMYTQSISNTDDLQLRCNYAFYRKI